MPYKDKDKAREYHKEYHKGWYQKNKEEVKARVSVRRMQSQLEIRDWYRRYKSTLSCIECGENHPACLQFHHRDKSEKKFEISAVGKRAGSLKALIREIEKCDVLCVNCHAKRHWRGTHESDNWEEILGSE